MSVIQRKRKLNEVYSDKTDIIPSITPKKRKANTIPKDETTNSNSNSDTKETISISNSMKCFNCNKQLILDPETIIVPIMDNWDEAPDLSDGVSIVRCNKCLELMGCEECCLNDGVFCCECDNFCCFNCNKIKKCDKCHDYYCKKCTDFKPKQCGGIECSECQSWWKQQKPASAFCVSCGSGRSNAYMCQKCNKRYCIRCVGIFCDECGEHQCENCNEMETCCECKVTYCDDCGKYCDCFIYDYKLFPNL
eukprot:45717_1